jgi:hypothetical protein
MAKRSFSLRRSGFRSPKTFIVVATEGRVTEELYLRAFKPSREAELQLTVLPNRNNKSHPRECLKRLRQHAQQRNLGGDDQLWVMIDRDQWSEADLNEVARDLAKYPNHFLALSNPCVEYWFLLHFQEPRSFVDGPAVLRDLKRSLPGYSKDNFDLEGLKNGVRKAIDRAERQDDEPGEPWPRNTGSRVYRLMRQILDRRSPRTDEPVS